MRITNDTYVRDNWGQFAREVEEAVADSMHEVAREGAKATQSFAPPALAGTFTQWPVGRLEWGWGSTHEWARGLNSGIPPHLIGRPGQFLTNRGDFAARGPVLHPGYVGDHFLEESLDVVQPDILPTMRRRVSAAVRGAGV